MEGTRGDRKLGRVALAAAVALCVLAAGGTALGALAGGTQATYTGCLTPKLGIVTQVKEGDKPLFPCGKHQTELRVSGGDITAVTPEAGGGLTGGGSAGDVMLGVAESYRLPQSCGSGDAVIRNPTVGGSAATWICGQFAAASQTCSAGQFARGVTPIGVLSCAAPPTGGNGVQVYGTSVGLVRLAGTTTVISKTVPAGTYLLSASVELVNQDRDSPSTGRCSMPGYTTVYHELPVSDLDGAAESLSLTSAVTHAGGPIVLSCSEVLADVDVERAALTILRVDSFG